ncbi:uncharacterized protein BYT42DRAFT_562210 [Radiomyces spectabilis]|uniref:uncharacterized protein n=1 Tax=Radiomyces spectabilis TaxID=64574 RepID=UPI0022209BB5|nr:uncharacterized protein BYT42DRAFT_562210 [Radiomyces spectabilis]KAI8384350.1 hypothetical protein BYT42DRAFT_562210 [Radiomyces spectabilis]
MRSLTLAISLSLAFVAGFTEAAKTVHTKVAILGGGVSAINAARNLTGAGIHDFMIIEARDSLGGRAQDAPFADIRLELGCNWVQGLGTNPVNQLRKKYGLKTAETDGDDVVFYTEGGKIDNGTEVYKKFNEVYERMNDMAFKRVENNQVDISVRAGLDLAGWYPMTPLDQAIEYYVFDWESAEEPEDSSMIGSALNDNATYSSFGEGSDGDRMVVDERGFKYIFLEEAKTFLKKDDSRVKLNTKVTKVEYNKHGVTVHTDQDLIIKADYAISTFSLGVLQHKDVEWSPALPDWKLEGIYGFHMATYTKIFLNFPYQFWDDNQFTVYADPDNRGYYNTWQNLNAPGYFPKNTSTNIFFVTVTQSESYRVEAMEDEEVRKEAMAVLRSMYGDDIPEATEIMFPRWHSNPLFRGSYSNWPIGELDQHHINMKAPLHNRLFFAGEAMSKEYFGFLQGAWFSGEETGSHVVQCIKKKCPRAEYYPIITKPDIHPNYIHKRSVVV